MKKVIYRVITLIMAIWACTPLYANSITINPLVNPSFEEGTTGWELDKFGSTTIEFRGTVNGVPGFSPTDGENFFGYSQNYTTSSSGISMTAGKTAQRVDVSSFDSISSVTFGGDVFGQASIIEGVGTVEFQSPNTGGLCLVYTDSDLNFIDSTVFKFRTYDTIDAINGFSLDDLRITDNTIPADTVFIDFHIFPNYKVGTQGTASVTANLNIAYDDIYLSVTGIPEPATLLLLSLGGLLLRRRRA